MDMPKPTEHHLKLKKLAGTWKGEEIMHPSPWDPRGGAATGHMTTRHALDGFAAISDYHQERDGAVTFTGHGVFTYDANDRQYVLHWFDSMGSPPEVFKGTLDGDTLTLGHGGPGIHARMTYDLSKDRRIVSRMEMSTDGKEWKTLFDGTYESK